MSTGASGSSGDLSATVDTNATLLSPAVTNVGSVQVAVAALVNGTVDNRANATLQVQVDGNGVWVPLDAPSSGVAFDRSSGECCVMSMCQESYFCIFHL